MELQEELKPFVIAPTFLNGPMLKKLTGLAMVNSILELSKIDGKGCANFFCGYMKQSEYEKHKLNKE